MHKKDANRRKRHFNIRKKIVGTQNVPRLCVSRSLGNMYIQLIDDISGKTLVGLSTKAKDVKSNAPYGGNVKAAEVLASNFATKVKEQGIEKICFDRSGFQYHGRIKTSFNIRSQNLGD